MLLDIIQKLNWIDVVIIVVMLRALYIGLKRGCVNEIFQLMAVLAAIFIIFHYDHFCSKFLENRIFFKPEIAQGVTFFALWALIALVCKFVRDGVSLVFKIEAKSFFDKIGGLSVAFIRGAFVASLLLALFTTTGSEYLSRNIQGSYFSSQIAPLAPSVYKFVFKGFINKYFPNEQMSQGVVASEHETVQKNQLKK